jgi:DNA-binding CsgD family transcriptional regulator
MPFGPVFLDRALEREALGALLGAARAGESGALVLYGEAGMGKSALLDYAVSGGDLPVARISGVETERGFGFAALHRLLLPFLHDLYQLPPPQRSALESAFGVLDDAPADLFVVALAALTLLSVASAGRGLLCIVDDAQWIDVESLQTLAFVGRRLRAEGIALLFGLRTYLDVPSDLAGIRALEVAGLPGDAATELLRMAAEQPVPERVAERVVTETNGCPLALWELGKTLTEGYSGGIAALDEPMAVSRRLEDHFNGQISSLSPDAQLFLLAASADISGDRALVRAAARTLGCTTESEKEAEHRRLLLAGPRVSFRHPLIRSAAYAGADPHRRREVHRTFANLISKTSYPDRWARHVVLGAGGPNEKLASELEETSQMARARGGHSAEAALLVQAADLTEPLELRADRLLKAAAATMRAGATAQVISLLDAAQPHLTSPLSIAESAQLRAEFSIRNFHQSEAPRLLLAAARFFIPLDMRRAREILLQAFDAYALSIHFTSGVDATEIADAARSTPHPEPATLEDHLLAGSSQLVSDGPETAFTHYRKAADLLKGGALSHDQIARWALFGIVVANELLDDRTYRAWAERTDNSARENGALLVLLNNLFSLAEADVRAGALCSATARLEEVRDVAEAIGMPADVYRRAAVMAYAWAGDEEQTRTCATDLIAFSSAVGTGATLSMGFYSLAVLHLGAGRYREAFEATEYVHTRSPIGWTSQALPLAVEAAVRSGQRELAESLLPRLEVRATASASPWAMGLLTRSQALLSEGSKAEELYQEALAFLGRTLVSRDLAHARLLYGEWLRRESRRVEAREQLRAAYDFFLAMGAKGFTKRAEAELLATGEHVRPRTVDRSSDLTPQERRIASLAAQRLSNPEIAAKLFISSTTVDYHLRKVFRKLGIASRRQLGEALRSQGLL